MMEFAEFIEQDILAIFMGLEGKDLAIPVSCLALIILFIMPLKLIDRRDVICGLMYVLYCVSAGTILFFGVQGVEDGLTAIGAHLAFTCLLGAAAAYRWFHSANDIKVSRATSEGSSSRSSSSSSPLASTSQTENQEFAHEKV